MQEDHPYSDIWNVNDALKFGKEFNANWDQQLADDLIDIFQLPRKKNPQFFNGDENDDYHCDWSRQQSPAYHF